jgi:hypothetical protein
MLFFLLYNGHCLLAHQVSLRHLAMRGEQKKNPLNKISKLKTLQIWTPLPIGAAQVYLSLVIQQISFTLHGDKIRRVLPIRQDITY